MKTQLGPQGLICQKKFGGGGLLNLQVLESAKQNVLHCFCTLKLLSPKNMTKIKYISNVEKGNASVYFTQSLQYKGKTKVCYSFLMPLLHATPHVLQNLYILSNLAHVCLVKDE